jgi:hypothetical protein
MDPKQLHDITSSGRAIFDSSIAFAVIAPAAVILRFLAKLETKPGLAADDYWITTSLALYWAMTGVKLWTIFAGGGGVQMRKIAEGSDEGLKIYLQVCSLENELRNQ